MLAVPRISILFLLLFFMNCSFQTISMCDDLDSKTRECKNFPEAIELKTDFEQKLKDFCYDLYFHKKITVGLIVNSTQPKASYNCIYRINQGPEFLLEGSRNYEDHFWCFDYLGSMILNYYKIQNQENLPIKELDPKKILLELDLTLLENNQTKKKR
jgi:hypothetical protein